MLLYQIVLHDAYISGLTNFTIHRQHDTRFGPAFILDIIFNMKNLKMLDIENTCMLENMQESQDWFEVRQHQFTLTAGDHFQCSLKELKPNVIVERWCKDYYPAELQIFYDLVLVCCRETLRTLTLGGYNNRPLAAFILSTLILDLTQLKRLKHFILTMTWFSAYVFENLAKLRDRI